MGVLYGIVVSLIMGLTSLPYAVTTGCICGAMMLIPFFGGPLSLLLPLIVSISSDPNTALVVIPILFIIQTVLLNVALPKIVGQSSGLGPVATLFVLLAGAQIGGVWGVLLGVPLVGVAVSTVEYLLKNVSRRETTIDVNLDGYSASRVEVVADASQVEVVVKNPSEDSISKP
jgi:predicted PurR-regulated permease PerM